MEIGAINFEDLFDFSPEPLEPPEDRTLLPISHPKVATTAQQRGSSAPSPATTEGSSPATSTLAAPSLTSPSAVASSSSPVSGEAELLSRSAPAANNWKGSEGHQGHRHPLSGGLSADGLNQAVKGKRGRKPGQRNLKTDMKSKLERSRQSARECRARKKLRYQYLDDLILEREKANIALREELLKYQRWCHELDKGRIPEGLTEMLNEHPAPSSSKSNKRNK